MDDIFSGLRASEAAGIQTLLVRNVINLRQNRWGSGGFAELVDSDSVSSEFQSSEDSLCGLVDGVTLFANVMCPYTF